MPSLSYIYGANPIRVRTQAWMIILFFIVQNFYTVILPESQKAVFMFREPNATNVKFNMYIHIPYEECRCNVVPIDSCLTDQYLKSSRVIPLIFFLLEVYLINDFLSLHHEGKYFLLNLFWIISIFAFFCLLIIVYRSSYYYYWITTLFICAAPLLHICGRGAWIIA